MTDLGQLVAISLAGILGLVVAVIALVRRSLGLVEFLGWWLTVTGIGTAFMLVMGHVALN